MNTAINQQKVYLKESHRNEWLASQVDLEIIDLNVKSLSGNNPHEYLLYSAKIPRLSGGRLAAEYLRKYQHLEHGGWWCSGVDIVNDFIDSVWGHFKPDRPRNDWRKGTPIKYESPAGGIPTEIFALKVPEHIWQKIADYWGVEKTGKNFWRWVLDNKEIPLVITEGSKKAGALLTLGFVVIALPGVNNGAKNQKDSEGEEIKDDKGKPIAELIPQLKAFTEGKGRREIILAFDADNKKKTGNMVEHAILKLGYLFEQAKCSVSVVEWDSKDGKGIDDLIVKKGNEYVYNMFDSRKPLKEYRFEKKQQAKKLNDLETADFIHDEFFVDGRLSFNEMSGKIHLDGKSWNPPDALNIYFYQEHNIAASREHLGDALGYYAKQNSFNPVKTYLERVAKESPRISIDNLATRYFGSTNELDNLKVKKMLISAVARAVKPGCKADCMLVLQGEQGIGKSTFFETLAGTEFFGNSVKDVKGKEIYMLLNTAWFQEIAELEKATTPEKVEDIKDFLSTKDDTYRELYERRPTCHPRHSIFVGSVNNAQFLRDKTGNRRFWIIKVQVPEIDYQLVALERDAIWAAAVDGFLAGEQWHFDKNQEKQNRLDNVFFEHQDEWETLIGNYIENKEVVSLTEIMTEVLGIEIKDFPKVTNKVASLLSKLEWEKLGQRQHRGQRLVVWGRKPEPIATPARGVVDLEGGYCRGGIAGGIAPLEPTPSKEDKTIDYPTTPIAAENFRGVVSENPEEKTPSLTEGVAGEWVAFKPGMTLEIGQIVETDLGEGFLQKYLSKSSLWQFHYNNGAQVRMIPRSDVLRVFKRLVVKQNGKH